jgi:hypothetical protein
MVHAVLELLLHIFFWLRVSQPALVDTVIRLRCVARQATLPAGVLLANLTRSQIVVVFGKAYHGLESTYTLFHIQHPQPRRSPCRDPSSLEPIRPTGPCIFSPLLEFCPLIDSPQALYSPYRSPTATHPKVPNVHLQTPHRTFQAWNPFRGGIPSLPAAFPPQSCVLER